MHRRLLLSLLLVVTCAALFPGKESASSGTCSQETKTCGGDPAGKSKKPEKAKKRRDVSEMWTRKSGEEEVGYDAEGQFDGKVARAVLAQLESKPRVLETACSELTGVCYEVVDRVWRDADGFAPNKWELVRQVQLKGEPQAHFGKAVLVKPEVLNWKTYDTKKWRVNKRAIIDRETQGMLSGLTGTRAVPRFEKNATREYMILLVGLGTPTIPNFLEKYYWMDIVVVDKEPLFAYFASKWFEMRKGPNLRILQADPISLMSYAVSQEIEFDAVLVNVCKDTVDRARPCPADLYLERSTIAVIKNSVRESGMVAVNTRSTEHKFEKEVANIYGGVLPMCFDLPGDHAKLTFERFKSTVCYARDRAPLTRLEHKDFLYDGHHDWYFFV